MLIRLSGNSYKKSKATEGTGQNKRRQTQQTWEATSPGAAGELTGTEEHFFVRSHGDVLLELPGFGRILVQDMLCLVQPHRQELVFSQKQDREKMWQRGCIGGWVLYR